jgi:hypothetical protein
VIAVDHKRLRTEIIDDPERIGYAPTLEKPNRADCARIAKLMNVPRDVGSCVGSLPVLRVIALLPDSAFSPRMEIALGLCGETVDLSEGSDFRAVLSAAKVDPTAMVAAATETKTEPRWQTLGLAHEVGDGDVHSALWPKQDGKTIPTTAEAVGGVK